MSKFKKISIGLLISFIVLFLVGYILLDRAATANLPKQLIIEKLETLTGNDVTIRGELHWHFSLHPSVVIEEITLTSDDEQIITLKNVNLKIQLSSLFEKPPLLESLQIDQLSYKNKNAQISLLTAVKIKKPAEYSAEISFQQWQQNQLRFSNGQSHVEIKNNTFILSKFSADFYQGNIQGNAKIDFNNSSPKIDITLNANQAEISGILSDIAHSAYVSGKMDVTADFSSQGKNSSEFIENLNGKTSILVKNGKLNTIHLDQLMPVLVSSPPKDIDVFSTLQADALIINGTADTTLKLLAKNYRSQGTGKINLIKQTLNLHFDSYYTRSEKTKEIAIPAEISGPIDSPEISVDISQPLNQFFKSDRKSLSEKIKKLLGRS